MNQKLFIRMQSAVATLVAILWMLLIATTSYAGGRDITGHYEAPPIARCSKESLRQDNIGLAYLHHCFSGNAYGYSTAISIIQNGDKVCGRFSTCGGRDCNQVYDGELVGRIQGDILIVYFADGHRSKVAAEELAFRIFKNGLAERGSTSQVPTLVARSVQMKYPEAKAACNPQIPERVMIGSNYELLVKGLIEGDKTTFVNLKNKKFARPLKPRSISLKGKPNEFKWEDKRSDSNTVVSQLILQNDTKHAWDLSVEHPDSCQEFLGSYYHDKFQKVGSETMALRTDSVTIASKQSMRLDSCSGSKWSFESKQNEKRACPKFQCLEGCKC